MDKESKSGSGGLSGNGIIAVVLLAAGVLFVREAPLETTRPPANESRLEQQTSTQDIDARLWQDPFGAVDEKDAQAVLLHHLSRAHAGCCPSNLAVE